MLRDECRFRVLENRTMTKIFGPKMEKVIVDWLELHNDGTLTKCYWGDQIMKDVWWGVLQVWRRNEICTGVWWRNLMEKNHLEHLQVDGRLIVKW